MNNNSGFLMMVFDHNRNLISISFFFFDKKFRDRMASNILAQLSPHTVVMKCPVKMLQGKT